MRAAVLLALVGSTLATTGFDAIGAISTTQMSCMHSHGHSFYIGRIYHSNGVVDNQGIQDMKNAWSGGLSHVDAYIFPCLSCSAGGAAQVKTAIDNLHNSGVKYGMVWLDIEIYQWKSDKTTNQNFIMAMANELDALKVNWGVYSSKNNWDNIVGDGWTKLSHKPLWWATYNGQATLTGGFAAFGGWTKPAIHQYTGDSSGPCGFSVDMNVLGVLLFSFFGATFATTGFDGIGGLTTTQFQCMKTNGHSFYIGRIYRSNGAVDPQGIQDMKNAWAGGLAHVDGYIFPCTNCGTTGASQVTTAINNLKSSGVKYGMVWVDIEVYKWGTDKTANRNFILSMTNQLTSMGITWGVYTNENNWSQIVGNDWTALSNKPLWWARYNNVATLTGGFSAFGGWTKPAIHQYAGDTNGPCGFSVDLNVY